MSYNYFMALREKEDILASLSVFPKCNRRLLVDLCVFLKEISRNAEKNMMSVENLALVFSPTLFRSNLDDPRMALKFAEKEKAFIRAFIESAETLSRE